MFALITEEINERNHKLLSGNRLIGYIIMDIDGFYYFDSVTQNNGFWGSHNLRMVADILDNMNEEHQKLIKEI
jgi:hypothetical protein